MSNLPNKSWVIGNWKQNPLALAEADALAMQLKAELAGGYDKVQVAVCPSPLHLAQVVSILADSQIGVGAQDVAHMNATIGAFTGDVSAGQVANLGATFTLIGHSERRQYHHEDNAMLSQKLSHAIASGLKVVYCVGESKAEYDAGNTLAVLASQLQVLTDVTGLSADNLLIAYEPVWAIGTGLVPTLDEISQAHQYIKAHAGIAGVAVLYGGSANDANASELAACADIDGVLVGGASLKVESFATMIHAFARR